MPRSFINDRNYWVLLVPFLYAFFSRMGGMRGFFFNGATLWAPGVLLVAGISQDISAAMVSDYFLGYLIFISIYEVGYLANDTYGLRGDPTPRRRIDVTFRPAFVTLFILARILAAILGVALLHPENTFSIAILISGLCVSIALHNLLGKQHFKFASFLQMSTLRFATPVLLALDGRGLFPATVVGLLLFAFPRLLTYQESKGRLSLPERKSAEFALINTAVLSPIVAVAAIISEEPVILQAYGYFCVLHTFTWFLRRGQRSKQAPKM